jgi:Endonuclease/Exonuclease/phosphatase family
VLIARRSPAAAAALLAGVALALILPLAAEAKPKKPKTVPVKVMTRNIFLGADLTPALAANNPNEFAAANGAILREVDQTNFPLRAQALAKEIRNKKPHLVGLQEVALWRQGPSNIDPATSGQSVASEVVYDFLDLLLEQVNKKKELYKVAVVQEEFDFEAPADKDGDPNTGTQCSAGSVPVCFGGEINGRLTMRDAILVRRKAGVKVKNATGGQFQNLLQVQVGGAVTVPVERGWTALDATIAKGKGKQKVKRKFRFVNTHLEAFDDETQTPSIRQLQAEELVAPGGPATSSKPVILLGDLNSDDDTVAPDDQKAYRALLAAGFTERSTDDPLSCCVSNLFTSPPSEFDHQVDHVMTDRNRRQVKLVNSSVTGLAQVNGLYPSDHAGVFSKLRLK